jgi:hypothetical protein
MLAAVIPLLGSDEGFTSLAPRQPLAMVLHRRRSGSARAWGSRPTRRCRRPDLAGQVATAWPACFLAMSVNAGPTSLLSMAWQAVQLCLFKQAPLVRARCAGWVAWPLRRRASGNRVAGGARGVGAALRPDGAVLLGQVAVGVARKVGQNEATWARPHSRSCRRWPARRAWAWPPSSLPGHRACLGGHAVAVGHAAPALRRCCLSDSVKSSGTTPPRLSRKAVTA